MGMNASVKNPPVVPFAMEFRAQGRGQETNTDSNDSCAQDPFSPTDCD